jgi:hypothetical protein
MLDALRFVASAVAKKDFVPELTHFKIRGGRVTGFNGSIALSSDIDVDLDVLPNALQLISAIRACSDTIALHITPAGRLAVRSGKFKAFVDCLPDEAQMFVYPEGDTIELGPNFMPGIKAVAPIMGIDASRPWAMGVRLSKQSMFATNNVMLVEYWHGTPIPIEVIIPSAAITELLRIDEVPTRVQVTETSISFWFGDKRWMRSQLLVDGGWPTNRMDEILSTSNGKQLPFPDEFFAGVETLKPFLSDRGAVFINGRTLATHADEGIGASVDVEVPGVELTQAYHHRQLMLLHEVATAIDWTAYPRPCMFTGARLRGALIGQRVS